MSSGTVKTQAESTHQARLDRRDEAERILTLARHLRRPEHRRAMVLRHREGWTIGQIASSLGVNHRLASRLVSRLNRLVMSREYMLLAIGDEHLPLRLKKIGSLIYLAGMTLGEAADSSGKKLHEVRAAKREIEGIAVGAMGSNLPSYRGRRNVSRPAGWDRPGVEVVK